MCVVDVTGLPFDEAVVQTGRALMAYKHAYYDPDQLDALIERVGRERGEELDIACYFNDRRPPSVADGGRPLTADEVRAALAETRFHWMARQDRPNERLFVTISDTPDTVELDICGDTHHVPPAALEARVGGMEAVAVAAVA